MPADREPPTAACDTPLRGDPADAPSGSEGLEVVGIGSDAPSLSSAAAIRRETLFIAADFVAGPYPPEVFTPMSDEEIKQAVAVMNEAVPHASERMHAAWARHWADGLRDLANDVEVTGRGE